MSKPLILASTSEIRCTLLRNACVAFEAMPARIDEDMVKASLRAEGASPRDMADTLAELKAQKISERHRDAIVIGCDQVLALGGLVLSKPSSPQDLRDQLMQLRGQTHKLLSAVVLYEGGEPIWRFVGEVRLKMRQLSETYIDDYISRNWEDVQWCVGGYMLEKEGARLFERVDGDYFHVLGLPLIELLSYLAARGDIAS